MNLNDITSLTNMLKQYEEILTESDDDTFDITKISNFKPVTTDQQQPEQQHARHQTYDAHGGTHPSNPLHKNTCE